MMLKRNHAIAIILGGVIILLGLHLWSSLVIPRPLAEILPDAVWVVKGRVVRAGTPVEEPTEWVVSHEVQCEEILRGDDRPLPPLRLTYRQERADVTVDGSLLPGTRSIAVTGSGREFSLQEDEVYFFLIADRFLEEGKPARLLRVEPGKMEGRLKILLAGGP